MTSYPAASTPVVIDASFAITAVLATARSQAALKRLASWHREGWSIVAPAHWIAEALSALRKLQFLGELSEPESRRAIDDLFALGVESVALDAELCHSAVRSAKRMTHSKAYDALYLALAESEGAELWTADGRLYRRADQLGIGRVRLLEG